MSRHLGAAGGRGLGAHAEALAPYRLLASRVIALAMRDLLTGGHPRAERESARTFLCGSRMLTHWCGLAELDPAVIGARARWFLEHGPDTPFARRKH